MSISLARRPSETIFKPQFDPNRPDTPELSENEIALLTRTLANDPVFWGLPWEEQRYVLIKLDPKFAALTPLDQSTVLFNLNPPKTNPTSDLLKHSLLLSLLGFPAGLVLWARTD